MRVYITQLLMSTLNVASISFEVVRLMAWDTATQKSYSQFILAARLQKNSVLRRRY